MSNKLSGWRYGACAFAVALAVGCGGESRSGNADETGEGGSSGEGGAGGTAGSPSTGGTTTSTGGSGQGGQTAVACDVTPCEGIILIGQALPTCCMSATACGVDLAGNCTDPQILEQFGGDGGGFDFNLGEPEEIVADPACAGTTVPMGDGGSLVLEGCCDASGVCGVSTANIPAFGGFSIPTMCVTSADAQGFGQGGMVEAGADVPCGSGAATDAGGGGSGGGGNVDPQDAAAPSADSGSTGDAG